MLRRFIVRSALLLAVNLAIFFGWLVGTAWLVKARHFGNSDTESSLLVMPQGQQVDVVILGTSHARNFARFGNHARLERILGKSVVNLSRGNGAGVVPMKAYLETFYDEGNRCRELVWFIDAWALYSANWNEEYTDYACEPFSFSFATRLLLNGASAPALHGYLRSKFSWEWVASAPAPQPCCEHRVARRDETAVRQRIENLYHAGTDEATFDRYASVVEEVVQLAQRQGTRVRFVLSPTLLGEEPGRARLLALLEDLERRYATPFHDLTVAIEETELFEDHDHLNTAGVERFAAEHLHPLLNGDGAPDSQPGPVASRPAARNR